ncbi:MAG: hypothetical protein FJ284_05430 [Planctomycetes bacterium]|nr:hypothetical protein [Planctomycetota bacterium]
MVRLDAGSPGRGLERPRPAVALWLVVALVVGGAAGSLSAAGWQEFVKSPADALRMAARGSTPIARDPGEADEYVLCAATEEAKAACAEASKDCREELEKLRGDRLAAIDLDIRVGGRAGNDYPCECRLEGEDYQPRRFACTPFTWNAAGSCNKPLYFEDWALERYGHSHGPLADPFISAAHFFVTLPVLPYKMGVELPWECVYPLGYYRPGSCAPWTVPAVPISLRGLAVEAATITGIVFVVP